MEEEGVAITVEREAIRFHPDELRTTLDQHCTVWKRTTSFDVYVDPEGRPIGFVDHEKYVVGKVSGSPGRLGESATVSDFDRASIAIRVASLQVLPPGTNYANFRTAVVEGAAVVELDGEFVHQSHVIMRWKIHYSHERDAVIAIIPLGGDRDR